jgi:preprotein translocase subunit SecG
MLKLFGFLISIFLIVIIFLKIPQENVGLASFATKTDLLGSPSSAQRSLNIFTGVGILIYFAIAIQLNFLSNSNSF